MSHREALTSLKCRRIQAAYYILPSTIIARFLQAVKRTIWYGQGCKVYFSTTNQCTRQAMYCVPWKRKEQVKVASELTQGGYVSYTGQRHVRADLRHRELAGAGEKTVGTAPVGYDGDGRMVTATVGATTTLYVGNYFERTGAITRTYYYHAGKRVAMRQNSTLYWLLTDHLGSTAVAVAASGVLSGELRYKAWGETRYLTGTIPTPYRFTGQREERCRGKAFHKDGLACQNSLPIKEASSGRHAGECLALTITCADTNARR